MRNTPLLEPLRVFAAVEDLYLFEGLALCVAPALRRLTREGLSLQAQHGVGGTRFDTNFEFVTKLDRSLGGLDQAGSFERCALCLDSVL